MIKCVVCGDGTVGKTCMLTTFATNKFPRGYLPTLFDEHTVDIEVEGQAYKLNLWDTAGQEQFDQLRRHAYPGADVFLICFSIANPESFENVKKIWVPEIQSSSPRVPFVLVGTKTDLRYDTRTVDLLAERSQYPVPFKQGVELAKELKAKKYLECSSLTQVREK